LEKITKKTRFNNRVFLLLDYSFIGRYKAIAALKGRPLGDASGIAQCHNKLNLIPPPTIGFVFVNSSTQTHYSYDFTR